MSELKKPKPVHFSVGSGTVYVYVEKEMTPYVAALETALESVRKERDDPDYIKELESYRDMYFEKEQELQTLEKERDDLKEDCQRMGEELAKEPEPDELLQELQKLKELGKWAIKRLQSHEAWGSGDEQCLDELNELTKEK